MGPNTSVRTLLSLLALICSGPAEAGDLEAEAVDFLERFDQNASAQMYQYSLASWAYNTDINQENSDRLVGSGSVPSL